MESVQDDWSHIRNGQSPPYAEFKPAIQKSPHDNRNYRLIRLENGLEAMLIHDPQADQAAASLNVAVGHLSDPDDMPGMAHFCEHLSFMGTEQYPRENDYAEFLTKNNGSWNAYTGPSNTVYHFAVGSPFLSEALSRFAAFFHSPLFSLSCTSREVNAIESENKKNLQVDMWRAFQLNKHLSMEGHVWRKFGSGNKESLSSAARKFIAAQTACSPMEDRGDSVIDAVLTPIPSPVSSFASLRTEPENDGGDVSREMRRRLLEWWNREYCAGRMKLCIIGNESLKQLAALTSTLFSPILNRGQEPVPLINQHPFGPNERSTFVTVQAVRSFCSLEILFPLPYQLPYWRYKPALFLGNLVGHEGPGSLHSYLTRKGWITSLSAGPYNLARGIGVFKVVTRLTKEGLRSHRQVLLAIFKYLEMLRSVPLPSWFQHEMSTLSNTQFTFAETRRPDNYAVWLSEHMLWPIPPEMILKAPQVVEQWDDAGLAEKELRDVLEVLRVHQARAMLMARAEDLVLACGQKTHWEMEPWYGTPYRVERFDEEFLALARSPNDIPELFLPKPNAFIPENLDVVREPVTQPKGYPQIIRRTPLSTVWHKKDDQFWVPKANIILKIETPVANETARDWTLTRLYSEVVEDSLAEFAYDAAIAELSYSFTAIPTGLCIKTFGYNDKISVLFQNVLQRARTLLVSSERLEIIKEKVKREWENFSLGNPYTLSNWYLRYLLTKQLWTPEERLAQISSINVQDIQCHIERLLSQIQLSLLITGNIHNEEGLRIAEMTEEILGSSPLPSRIPEVALILPQDSNFVYQTLIPNSAEHNSALTYYVHFGRLTTQRTRVKLALLAQILSEPAFNTLRTKEQLGYVVFCYAWELKGWCDGGIAFVVQSEKHPKFIESRVDAFLDRMRISIEDMDPAQFEKQKAGLSRKWRQVPKNLTEETDWYWNQIDSGRLDFMRKDQDAELLETIDKQDILAAFLEAVHPASATRAKLSVHLCSQSVEPQRIASSSAKSFEQMVRNSGIIAHERAWGWRGELDDDGAYSASELERHWKDALGDGKEAQELIGALSRFVDVRPSAGGVMIQNVKAFKDSLSLSDSSDFCYKCD